MNKELYEDLFEDGVCGEPRYVFFSFAFAAAFVKI